MLIHFLLASFNSVEQHKSISIVLIDYFAYLISIFIAHVTADLFFLSSRLIDQIVFYQTHLFIVHH